MAVLGVDVPCVEPGACGRSFFPEGCSLGNHQAPKMEAAHKSLHGVSGHIRGVAIAGPLLEQHLGLEEWDGYEGAAHCPPGLGSSSGSAAACPICSGTSPGS